MSECLPDFPRYVKRAPDGSWYGADHQNGPWRPIPAPQSGLPWKTDGPAVPESREPASVAADARPLSPAAQAVLDAANGASSYGSADCLNEAPQIAAAALRAVADQVVPDEITWASPSERVRHWPSAYERAGQQGMACVVRRKLILIAAELEGHHG